MKVQFETEDQVNLAGELFFSSEKEVRGLIILNRAPGLDKTYYTPFIEYLTKNGYSVLSYDYRGTGDSPKHMLKNIQKAIRYWSGPDISAALDFSRRLFENREITVIGHCIGGTMLNFCQSLSQFDNIILIDADALDSSNLSMGEKIKVAINRRIIFPLTVLLTGRIPKVKPCNENQVRHKVTPILTEDLNSLNLQPVKSRILSFVPDHYVASLNHTMLYDPKGGNITIFNHSAEESFFLENSKNWNIIVNWLKGKNLANRIIASAI